MKKKKMYAYCDEEKGRETTTLHEVFYGTANRKISIKHHLQVPVLYFGRVHRESHGPGAKAWAMKHCEFLMIDYWETVRRLNDYKENKKYFKEIEKKCYSKLQKYIV